MRYVRKTITFLLPEHKHLLDQLDAIIKQQHSNRTTDAIRFLIDYHTNVAPIAGSTVQVARLLSELRHNGTYALGDILSALEQELPGSVEKLKDIINH